MCTVPTQFQMKQESSFITYNYKKYKEKETAAKTAQRISLFVFYSVHCESV